MAGEASFDTANSAQSLLQPQFMQRRPNVYAIYETEMETLATWNQLGATAFTLAGSFLAFAVGLWVQAEMSDELTPLAQAMVALGIPASVLLAVVATTVGIFVQKKRGGTLAKIKSESRALPSDVLDRS